MMRMSHLQVEAPHGLKGNSLLRVPKGTGLAIRDPDVRAKVRTFQVLCCQKKHKVSNCRTIYIGTFLTYNGGGGSIC